ncbi:HesB/YadR/YfhF family protein [Lentibacillus amyloliquefaciens]|uniref:FeS cluster biogenesis domain-containing protein n=1 Tax=Lentibacillus amyloliquefaciens TaxID=1472767 RepID=A0A0U4FJD8_9BACI|nr:hypothetical protein [Lentibacillus amyloliquefaciens]ALX47876.1 hypothetical protein AOX59_04225 [Lentibacillus amyloliquefaciens]
MKLKITNQAGQWYKDEFDIDDRSYQRFFVRYGGFGGRIPGFSLGLGNDVPEDIYASCDVAGITFYIENKDAWYFDGQDLSITLDEKTKEPKFHYN